MFVGVIHSWFVVRYASVGSLVCAGQRAGTAHMAYQGGHHRSSQAQGCCVQVRRGPRKHAFVCLEGQAGISVVCRQVERRGERDCRALLSALFDVHAHCLTWHFGRYDLSMPIQHMYCLVEDMRERLHQRFGPGAPGGEIRVTGYGHMADGNLHLNISGVHTHIMCVCVGLGLRAWVCDSLRGV